MLLLVEEVEVEVLEVELPPVPEVEVELPPDPVVEAAVDVELPPAPLVVELLVVLPVAPVVDGGELHAARRIGRTGKRRKRVRTAVP